MDDRSPPNPKARWMYVQFALTIATVEDRIVQTAMKRIMQPIFDAEFQECSYGYRPNRDAKQASEASRQDVYQHAWSVVERDFQTYFTSISYNKLIELISRWIWDESLLKLIEQKLKIGISHKGS